MATKPLSCKTCPLYSHSVVPYTLGTSRDILLVAQSPGQDEVKAGKPLVGRSGQLLDKVLRYVGIERSKLSIANALRCYEGNPPLPPSQIQDALIHCRPLLSRFINGVRPSLIIVCGNYALKTILGKDKITDKRGKFFHSEEFGVPVFVTLHPAAVLRECSSNYPDKPYELMNMKERDFLRDFKTIAKTISNEKIFTIDSSNYRKGTQEELLEISKSELIAFDFETSGVDGYPISVSFSTKEGESRVYLLKDNDIPINILESKATKIVAARPFDENLVRKFYKKEVGGQIHDVLTLAHVLDENYYAYNLENIASVYADMSNIKSLAEGYRENLTNAPEDVLIKYNGVDSDATLKSFNAMYSILKKEPELYNYYTNFILPVQDALSKISLNGCLVDKEILINNINMAKNKLQEMSDELIALVPETIKKKHEGKLSLTRPDFVADAIFEGFKCKPNPKFLTAKEKKPQVTEDALKDLEHIPFVKGYIRWKKLHKIVTSYLTPLLVKNFIKSDGRIYPTTSLTRTVTGRTVALNPPIQTYPQRGEWRDLIRSCIVPDDGWYLCNTDLSQSELRIIGWIADDKNILNALYNGIDLHTKTASIVMNKPINEITEDLRFNAKAVNFGFIYGMSAEGFKNYAKTEYGIDYSLEECINIRNRFFAYPNGYWKLPEYYKKIEKDIKTYGYVSSVLGRRRRFPNAKGNNDNLAKVLRQAINFPIQSFSSDLGLIGLMLFVRAIEKNKLADKIKPMWFIHDSIIYQVKDGYVDEAKALLTYCLTTLSKEYIKKYFNVSVGYPIECKTKTGKSWAEL